MRHNAFGSIVINVCTILLIVSVHILAVIAIVIAVIIAIVIKIVKSH